MLFSEIYGAYFNVVADILSEAIDGTLTEKRIYEIVEKKAYGESALVIPAAIKDKEWPLITDDMQTPLVSKPDMPLTTLQKRWMKALIADPRIQLFGVDDRGLEDVKPLYSQDTIIYSDQYSDGDDFTDAEYIRRFQIILKALREKRKLRIKFVASRGRIHNWVCVPVGLEYSRKDDKFRLRVAGSRSIQNINLARMLTCELLDSYDETSVSDFVIPKAHVSLEVYNQRNALERVMLAFSHLEKETVKITNGRYLLNLTYNAEDETEILIRILSFGPMVRVIGPDSFIEIIRERLNMQRQL